VKAVREVNLSAIDTGHSQLVALERKSVAVIWKVILDWEVFGGLPLNVEAPVNRCDRCISLGSVRNVALGQWRSFPFSGNFIPIRFEFLSQILRFSPYFISKFCTCGGLRPFEERVFQVVCPGKVKQLAYEGGANVKFVG
jgi:hypothetical protein